MKRLVLAALIGLILGVIVSEVRFYVLAENDHLISDIKMSGSKLLQTSELAEAYQVESEDEFTKKLLCTVHANARDVADYSKQLDRPFIGQAERDRLEESVEVYLHAAKRSFERYDLVYDANALGCKR